jgi:hypothetical protein
MNVQLLINIYIHLHSTFASAALGERDLRKIVKYQARLAGS